MSDSFFLEGVIETAGPGGAVILSPETYILDRGLTLLEGQRFIGNGVTLKRCDQIVTTTATAMVGGVDNIVTLDDAAGFVAGMQVALAKAGVARSALELGVTLTHARTITDVTGNDVTLDQPVNCDMPIGSTCFLTFVQIASPSDVAVEGVTFDGNAANWPFSRWEVTAEAASQSTGTGQSFRSCRFVNAPGEGIIAQGGDVGIHDNWFDTIGGNAIHLSGAVSPRITGNRGTNGNIDIAVGHADGFICFSNSNFDTVITGNQADTFIAGVGSMNDTDGKAIVTGNVFNNMYCFGIEGGAGMHGLIVANNRINGAATDPSKRPGGTLFGGIILVGLSGSNYTITGNQVENVATGNPACAISMLSGASDLKVMGNIFRGDVALSALYDAEFTGNTVTGRLSVWQPTRTRINGNTVRPASNQYGIDVYGDVAFDELEIENNRITGGVYGITFTATATSYTGVSCKGNKLYDQSQRGINVPVTTAPISGFTIDGNSIRVGPNAAVNFFGIVQGSDNVSLVRNSLVNAQGSSSRIAIYLNGTNTPKAVVADNEVRGAWQRTMLLTLDAKAVVRDNIMTAYPINERGNYVSGTSVLW